MPATIRCCHRGALVPPESGDRAERLLEAIERVDAEARQRRAAWYACAGKAFVGPLLPPEGIEARHVQTQRALLEDYLHPADVKAPAQR